MGKFNSFEEIVAWKKSREFNKDIYLITDPDSRFKRDFDLIRQIRRACISISSNIAEGFERTDKEFVYFLYVAKASAGEVRSQLYLTYDLDYLTEDEFQKLNIQVSDISKLISGLIKFLIKA